MPKITADLVARSPCYMNALRERELDLRSNHIPAIENLGTTNDAFDSIDLSFNDVSVLENFPLLRRLTTLIIGNNRISRIAPTLHTQVPGLRLLVLTANRIDGLKEISSLAGLRALEQLVLVDNPVVHQPNYRLFVIHTMPQLRILDFRRIRKVERQQAAALFAASQQPAAAPPAPTATTTKTTTTITEDDKAKKIAAIKTAIQNAKTLDEVAALERALAAGKIPCALHFLSSHTSSLLQPSDATQPPGTETMDTTS